MKKKVLTLLIGFMALLFAATDVQAQTATVETDKADYQPGDTVIITGTGWQPGETVKLEIDQSSVSHGSTTIYTTANSNGEINNQEFLILPIHLGEVFNLVATGFSSLMTASTVFTDANFTSTGSGNWNSASTWIVSPGTDSDGIPDTDDIVRILSGHTVYVVSGGTGTAGSVTVGSNTGSGTAVLELQGTGRLAVSGSLTLGGGVTRLGSLRFTGAGTLSLSANFTAPQLGTFTPGTGTIEYKGDGIQTILSTASLGGNPYHNLTISGTRGSSSVTLSVFSLTGDYTDNASFASGRYITNNAEVTFTGTTNQKITGSGNKTSFWDIIINNSGAANSNIVEVTSFSFAAPPGFLILTDGIFKFSRPIPIIPFSLDPKYPAAAGFWNNGGTVSTSSGLTLNGLLRNSAGTITIGNADVEPLSYTTGSVIIIDGGAVNVVASIRPFTSGSTITYNQSAGTLTVGTIGSFYTSTGMFDIRATGSSFTMSGGRIVIERNNNSLSVADYLNLASTYNVTGGTVQIGNASTPAGQSIKINSTVPIFNLSVDASMTTKIAQFITNGLTIKNDLTISGGTLSTNNLGLTVGGNWTNSGTFTPGTGTVYFNGTAVQAIQGSAATTFNNLDVHSSGGLTINAPTVIRGVLNFQGGLITPNTGTLTIESSGSILNATSARYVNGKLGWVIPPTLAKTFPIGKGGNYRPVTFKYNSVSGTSTVSIEQFESPLTGTLPANTSLYNAKYWDISQTGGTNPDFNITLDPTGFTPIGTAQILKKESGTISSNAATVPNYTNSTAFTSLAGTNSFALGETFTKTTTVASSAAITYGDISVTLSASVSPIPTSGTVSFFVDEIAAGTGSIDNSGAASVVYDPHFLTAGSHTIRAEFNGSDGYDASSSGPSANGILTINKKELTASLTGTVSKLYNGAINATLIAGNYNLPGIINGDVVDLNNPESGTYDTKNVGTDKTVNVSGLSISGTDSGNYSLVKTTASADIGVVTEKALVIAITADNKVYDGNATAATTAFIVEGLVQNDVVTVASHNGVFNDKNVDNGKSVTANVTKTGMDAGNYSANTTATATASITQKSLIIAIAAQDKIYDGSSHAATSAYIFSGLIEDDVVIVTSTNGLFNNKNVGTDKAVTANVSREGMDAGNYSANTTATTTASITQKALVIAVAAQDKVYDGNIDAATTAYIFSGLVEDDEVMVSSKNGSFDNKNVGSAKVVTAEVSKAGTDAGNYSANSTAATNANISQKALLIAITAENKVYDGNAIATVVLKDDRVTDDLLSVAYTEASFADKNVGTEIPVSINGISIAGTDAGNYTFNTAAATIADITARVLSVTAYNESRYCGMENPTFTGSGAVGSINGETFAVSYTSPGTIASSAGYYPITPSISENTEGAILTNYSISLYDGNLTVNSLSSIDASASSSPVPLGSSAILSAKISPPVAGVLITFRLNGDIQGTGLTNNLGVATYTTSGLLPDVYTVEATAGSNCLAPTIAYLPVYDPNGGFVTGGGWILSPIVSGKTYMEKTGKANFGFVAKYKKGSNAVDGNTEFQFNAGNLNFKSQTHDAMSLVIAGAKAIYKGQGTINGSPGYSFMVSAIDGNKKTIATPDAFRIKIWNASTNEIVYDNQIDQPDNADATSTLGGGSVVIHQVGSKQSTITPLSQVSRGLDMRLLEGDLEQKINLRAYPNPFRNQASIAFTLPSNEQMVTLDVYDLKGSKISRMYEGKASANQTMEFNFNGSNLSAGMYFLRLTTPTKVENFKMIMTE